MLGAALTELKQNDEAKIWNRRARSTVRFANFGVYNLGCVAVDQGDTDLALAYLNYSADIGFTDADHMQNDGLLSKLHDDPRFQALLKRLRSQR